MLTYDQMSELRMAFNEAHVPMERRRSPRIATWCDAEIAPWDGRATGEPLNVTVTDFSTTGIGIVHTGRLRVGAKYVLAIPRPERGPLKVLFTVVRCSERDGGMFDAELTPEQILDVVDYAARAKLPRPPQPGRGPVHRALIALAFLLCALAVAVKLLEMA